jgi:hypothetical protein
MNQKYTNYLEYLKTQLSAGDFERVKEANLNLEAKVWADIAVDFVNFEKTYKNS